MISLADRVWWLARRRNMMLRKFHRYFERAMRKVRPYHVAAQINRGRK